MGALPRAHPHHTWTKSHIHRRAVRRPEHSTDAHGQHMRGQELIQAILSANHGVIRTRQHRSLRSTIWRLTRAGILTRVLPGTYLLTTEVHRSDRWLAAVCAWKPRATIATTTAQHLHNGTLPEHSQGLTIDLHCPTRTRAPRTHPQLRVRTRQHPAGDTMNHHGITVLTPTATAIDLAAHDKGAAIDTLLRQHHTTAEALSQGLDAYHHTPGQPTRRVIVHASAHNPYSYAERLLHHTLIRAGITDWVANKPIRIAGSTLIPDLHLTGTPILIEIDGREFHSSPGQFESDRHRQNLLTIHGYTVLRFTLTMLQDHPDEVIRTIRTLQKSLARPR